MTTLIIEKGTYRTEILSSTSCPYLDPRGSICGASLTGLPVEAIKKEKLCSTENSWDCPMLLSKILRRP